MFDSTTRSSHNGFVLDFFVVDNSISPATVVAPPGRLDEQECTGRVFSNWARQCTGDISRRSTSCRREYSENVSRMAATDFPVCLASGIGNKGKSMNCEGSAYVSSGTKSRESSSGTDEWEAVVVSGAKVSVACGPCFERSTTRSWYGTFHSVTGFLAAPTNTEPKRKEVLARVDWRRWLVSSNSLVLDSSSLTLRNRCSDLAFSRRLSDSRATR